MKMHFVLIYFALIKFNFIYSLTLAKCSKNEPSRAILKTTSGYIKGKCDHVRVYDENVMRDANVYMWLGIPYAEAPIGKNRFEAPIPVNPWRYMLDCTKWPQSCIQSENSDQQDKFDGYKMWKPNRNVSDYSEDCLYLNIWTPVDAFLKKSTKVKVYEKASIMVFMNDYGLTSGTSALDIFDPSTFVALTGIIVVTVNYRLGVFGFMHVNGYLRGNQALLDQHLAMKWIYENAENFGGDSSKITIAGSSLVGFHLFYQPSWRLFRNTILYSDSPFKTSLSPIKSRDATNRSLKFAEYVDCGHKETVQVIKCLKDKKSFELLKSSNEYFFNNILNMNDKTSAYLLTYFPLVIDGVILKEMPKTALKNKKYKNCSILTGLNFNEGSLIIDKTEPKRPNQKKKINLARLYNFLEQYYYYYPQYPIRSDKEFIKKIVAEYTKSLQHRNYSVPIKDLNYYRILENLLTHESYTCNSLKFADEYSSNNKVYMYLYSQRISTSPWISEYGIVHGDEFAMIFAHPVSMKVSSINSNPWLANNKTYSISERDLCYQIVNYWSNFIRNNDPNSNETNQLANTITWPEYKSTNGTKILNLKNTKIQLINNFSIDKCKLWNNLTNDF